MKYRHPSEVDSSMPIPHSAGQDKSTNAVAFKNGSDFNPDVQKNEQQEENLQPVSKTNTLKTDMAEQSRSLTQQSSRNKLSTF